MRKNFAIAAGALLITVLIINSSVALAAVSLKPGDSFKYKLLLKNDDEEATGTAVMNITQVTENSSNATVKYTVFRNFNGTDSNSSFTQVFNLTEAENEKLDWNTMNDTEKSLFLFGLLFAGIFIVSGYGWVSGYQVSEKVDLQNEKVGSTTYEKIYYEFTTMKSGILKLFHVIIKSNGSELEMKVEKEFEIGDLLEIPGYPLMVLVPFALATVSLLVWKIKKNR
jgi:hypothetical protein